MNTIGRTATGTPARVVPERIREAREASGYTVEAFAEALGITRQAVGQFESGQTTPSAESMSQIIALTTQPPSFFTTERPRKSNSSGTPFWRGLKRMNKPDRARISRRLEWAWDIVSYVEQYLELPAVNLPTYNRDWETLDEEALERLADHVRDSWGLGRGPVFHLSKILEANGVILIKEPVRCDDMDAVSRWQGGRPYILCSADRDELPRFNFDLAHELLHLLAHHGVEVTVDNINKIEKQANYFAGAFLMPREIFAREVVSTSVNYFFKLKERWRVSVAAMVYRCKELGILNASQVQYLYRQLTARNMRRREPLDTAFRTESPSVLITGVSMLIEHGVQSKAQILDAVRLNPRHIESLLGTESGFFGETVVPIHLRPEHRA